VSEYQYYDFKTIDRALTDVEMDALRSISTRAAITPSSFTNRYEWGDLKADPLELLEKYFDAFVYLANWGTRRFWIRLPAACVDETQLAAMLPGDAAWIRRAEEHLIIGFDSEADLDDFDDGTGWMGSLVSLRSDLLRDDFRCLYLGWLVSVQNGELAEEEVEPPVPAGLGELSSPLYSLIEFLGIDEDLVQVAAATSSPLGAGPTPNELHAWIRNLPDQEKNELLVTAALESGERWRNELMRRFHEQNKPITSPISDRIRRNVSDLLTAAQAGAKAREQRLEEERAVQAARRKAQEEAYRARYLDELVKREQATWHQVAMHIQKRQPKEYDKAVQLLSDLRDLAVRQDREPKFEAMLEELRATHSAKASFLYRLSSANL
jgi:hypothetical protein